MTYYVFILNDNRVYTCVVRNWDYAPLQSDTCEVSNFIKVEQYLTDITPGDDIDRAAYYGTVEDLTNGNIKYARYIGTSQDYTYIFWFQNNVIVRIHRRTEHDVVSTTRFIRDPTRVAPGVPLGKCKQHRPIDFNAVITEFLESFDVDLDEDHTIETEQSEHLNDDISKYLLEHSIGTYMRDPTLEPKNAKLDKLVFDRCGITLAMLRDGLPLLQTVLALLFMGVDPDDIAFHYRSTTIVVPELFDKNAGIRYLRTRSCLFKRTKCAGQNVAYELMHSCCLDHMSDGLISDEYLLEFSQYMPYGGDRGPIYVFYPGFSREQILYINEYVHNCGNPILKAAHTFDYGPKFTIFMSNGTYIMPYTRATGPAPLSRVMCGPAITNFSNKQHTLAYLRYNGFTHAIYRGKVIIAALEFVPLNQMHEMMYVFAAKMLSEAELRKL